PGLRWNTGGKLATRCCRSKIVDIEPLASMPIDEVVAAVGPAVQRYLTGDIGTGGA
ncbi:TetR/AcrR family transcriptional regulator, partial [Nocardia sp. NPDC003648]